MRRTLVALLFTFGLSACGGVEPVPAAEEDTHSAMEWCEIGDPSCEELQGTACSTAVPQAPCCNPWGRETCICLKREGYWMCPL